MAAPARIIPMPDRDSGPYWAALAEGHLDLQHCRDCGHWTWPARPLCSGCQGENLAWEPVKGTGEVHSWIITHQVYAPSLADLVPYVTVLVRLDEQDDILIPGRLALGAQARQGLRVHAVPERLTDTVGELAWEAEEKP
jgi:uncharacterized OB-fold protein